MRLRREPFRRAAGGPAEVVQATLGTCDAPGLWRHFFSFEVGSIVYSAQLPDVPVSEVAVITCVEFLQGTTAAAMGAQIPLERHLRGIPQKAAKRTREETKAVPTALGRVLLEHPWLAADIDGRRWALVPAYCARSGTCTAPRCEGGN